RRSGHRVLARARHRADRGGPLRHADRADDALAALQARPPLWPAADVRARARHPGRLSQRVRIVGPPLPDPRGAAGRREPGLHVPADLPRLGDHRVAHRLPDDVVRDRAHEARQVPPRGHREYGAGASVRHQRPADDHAHVRLRRGARRARGRDGRAHLPGEPADGARHTHRSVRRGRHRRHGLDHGRHPDWIRPRRRRRAHEIFLSRSFQHGDLRHHGHRADDQAGRPVRTGALMATAAPIAVAARRSRTGVLAGTAVMTALLAIAPFAGIYPVFMMKALCFALFACAFNLLLGFGGLLSFGHAMFLGTAGYVCAHAAKVWGFPPELAILVGTVASAALGIVVGALAIRRQGIYFAMITLAVAQMMFFFYLQMPFTHGEDGIQAVPRGVLFGVLDLSRILTMYYVVLAVFVLGFLFIYRVIHSPFGQVLKAIRENEPRAISLGYDADRYKLIAFILSATLAQPARAAHSIVFQLASLTDVHWTMSGEVVLMTLLGGMGTIFGPVIGAFAITAIENYFSGFGQWVTIITGVIFVICVLAFRRGIVGELG